MQYTKPKENLPAVRQSMDLMVRPEATIDNAPVRMKLVAIIPPKVSGISKPVDSKDIGNKLNVFA